MEARVDYLRAPAEIRANIGISTRGFVGLKRYYSRGSTSSGAIGLDQFFQEGAKGLLEKQEVFDHPVLDFSQFTLS